MQMWAGLKTIAMVESERTLKGETSYEVRTVAEARPRGTPAWEPRCDRCSRGTSSRTRSKGTVARSVLPSKDFCAARTVWANEPPVTGTRPGSFR
jgi:hypothetical protein